MPAQRKLLVGLIGSGIQLSLTPGMHEEEAAQHGLRLHYQLIDLDLTPGSPEQLRALLSSARIMGFAGLNVTFPCKQAVVPLLDELAPEARAIGAVNTIVLRDGTLVGHNTDGWGWAWGLRRALPAADLARVVLVGAGGAGSAIADAVLRLGAGELRLVDNETARAQALAQALNTRWSGRITAEEDPARALHDATGVIHATPTGMAKLPGTAISVGLLRPSMWVSEIVYFPIETELLRAARRLGCPTMDGGAMAVGQAIGAFELFTGLQADPVRMERRFLHLLARR